MYVCKNNKTIILLASSGVPSLNRGRQTCMYPNWGWGLGRCLDIHEECRTSVFFHHMQSWKTWLSYCVIRRQAYLRKTHDRDNALLFSSEQSFLCILIAILTYVISLVKILWQYRFQTGMSVYKACSLVVPVLQILCLSFTFVWGLFKWMPLWVNV